MQSFKNPIKDKSYNFALEIVEVYKMLVNNKEFVLSKQLLRSGTSIGANVWESTGSHTKKEFISKMAIAYKETLETSYWLNLLKDSDYLTKKKANTLIEKTEELTKILVSIQKTSKKNLK